MIYHVLPGDSLVDQFKDSGIDGEVIVFREALIAGDVSGQTLDEFWDVRSNFVALEYGGDPIEYQEKVAYEVERLLDVTADDSIFLWFEYELFCQSNMWFLLDLLSNSPARIFRVQPLNALPDNVWDGFAASTPDDLRKCFDDAEEFTSEDISMGQKLWEAFRERMRRGFAFAG